MPVVVADMTKLNLKDPLTNLMLNMMGGLRYEDCTEEEKKLLKDNGYEPNSK
jgi:hypothetical protein